MAYRNQHWYGVGSIPINTIFRGIFTSIYRLFWCELQGYYWFWHTAIYSNQHPTWPPCTGTGPTGSCTGCLGSSKAAKNVASWGHSGGSRWGETHDVMEVALYRWIISWNIPTANWMRTGGIPSDLGSPFFFEKHISDAGGRGNIESHQLSW